MLVLKFAAFHLSEGLILSTIRGCLYGDFLPGHPGSGSTRLPGTPNFSYDLMKSFTWCRHHFSCNELTRLDGSTRLGEAGTSRLSGTSRPRKIHINAI